VRLSIDTRKATREATRKLDRIADRRISPVIKKELRSTLKPVRVKVRQNMQAALPKRGGLSRRIRAMPTVSVHATGPKTAAKLKLQQRGHDIRGLNRGVARHPVYGNKKAWRNTYFQDKKGWFEKTLEKERDNMLREVARAVDKAVKQEWRR